MNPEEFIESHTELIKPIFTKSQEAYWNASISGKQEDFKEYEKLIKELAKIYNNKDDFEKIVSFKKANIQNNLTKRQIEILYNSYLSSQGDLNLINEIIEKETEIEQKFNNYRAEIKGEKFTDNKIREILETETDSKKLQEVWGASKKQGEVVSKELIELVKLRNKLARSLGFENYYILSLTASEQNINELKSIFGELSSLTEKPFRELKEEIDKHLSKRYSILKEELKPWHYQDLFFQEGPKIYKADLDKIYSQKDIIEISKKFYKSIGLDVEAILKKSSLYEQPGKSQHAFCIDIDREGDIRILENIKNNAHWMETTLHELGHGVYEYYISKSLPFTLRRHSHIFVTEAIAMLFGRQEKNISFIQEYFNADKITELSEDISSSSRLRQLVFSRWTQVMVNFEMELYKNPEQDLNRLWYNLVKKYQLLNFQRDKPDWASKIHFVSSPVYYHNYMLGELLASQIHRKITKDILKQNPLANSKYAGRKEIGNYLIKEIFSKGKTLRWNELIKQATGENLSAKYFTEEFVNK